MEGGELALNPLQLPDVITNLKTREDGWIETEWNGTRVFVVYEHIEALKWYYVIIADLEQLVNGADISHIINDDSAVD